MAVQSPEVPALSPALRLFDELFEPSGDSSMADVDVALSAAAAAFGTSPADLAADLVAAGAARALPRHELLSATSRRSWDPSVVEVCATSSDAWIRELTARNPTAASVPGLLERLADDESELVQWAVARHNWVTDQVLERLAADGASPSVRQLAQRRLDRVAAARS